MKITIPVNEKSMDGGVCMSFGRTPYFLIYDTQTKESVFLNNEAANSPGGAGIKAAQMVVDNDVEAMITPRCGKNAADVLKAANIKIYKSINDSIKDNIDALINGKISLLDEIHGGFHSNGGK